MDYGIYTIYIDYGNGGHHEMVGACEDRDDAIRYAKSLRDQILACTDPFFAVDETHDGFFLFRPETITGIRVVPDIGAHDDDDDDDDDAPDEAPDGPPGGKSKQHPKPMTHAEFQVMMGDSNAGKLGRATKSRSRTSSPRMGE